jgi:hypothetical protein
MAGKRSDGSRELAVARHFGLDAAAPQAGAPRAASGGPPTHEPGTNQ